jgi:hypothetical protein
MTSQAVGAVILTKRREGNVTIAGCTVVIQVQIVTAFLVRLRVKLGIIRFNKRRDRQ